MIVHITKKRLVQALLAAAIIAFAVGSRLVFFDLTSANTGQPVVNLSQAQAPLKQVQTKRKAIALTFDIAWGDKVPAKVVSILNKEGAGASFFVTGPWAATHQKLLKRMASQGSTVGSGGFEYRDLTGVPSGEVKQQLEKTNAILTNLGVKPAYFRPPGGKYNKQINQLSNELGQRLVLWSIDGGDWKGGSGLDIQQIVEKVKPGAIIWLHASDFTPAAAKQLPKLIKDLRDEGYQLDSLDQLMTSQSG